MKKSYITLSLLVAVTLVLSACSFNGVSINVNTSTIQGSGKINSEERTVQDFTRVELKSIGNLTITVRC